VKNPTASPGSRTPLTSRPADGEPTARELRQRISGRGRSGASTAGADDRREPASRNASAAGAAAAAAAASVKVATAILTG
jgi:hypothetical protein